MAPSTMTFPVRLLLLSTLLSLSTGCAVFDAFSDPEEQTNNGSQGTNNKTTGTSPTGGTSNTSEPLTDCADEETPEFIEGCVEVEADGVELEVLFIQPNEVFDSDLVSNAPIGYGERIGRYLYVTQSPYVPENQVTPKTGVAIESIDLVDPELSSYIEIPFDNLVSTQNIVINDQTLKVEVDDISSLGPGSQSLSVIKGRITRPNNKQSAFVGYLDDDVKPHASLLVDLDNSDPDRFQTVQRLAFNPMNRRTSPLFVLGNFPPRIEPNPLDSYMGFAYDNPQPTAKGRMAKPLDDPQKSYDLFTTRPLGGAPQTVLAVVDQFKEGNEDVVMLVQEERGPTIKPQYYLYSINELIKSDGSMAMAKRSAQTPATVDLGASTAEVRSFADECKIQDNPELSSDIDIGKAVRDYKRRLEDPNPIFINTAAEKAMFVPYVLRQRNLMVILQLSTQQRALIRCIELPFNSDLVVAYNLASPTVAGHTMAIAQSGGEELVFARRKLPEACNGNSFECKPSRISYDFKGVSVRNIYALDIGEGFLVALELKSTKEIFYLHMDKDGALTNRFKDDADPVILPSSENGFVPNN